MNILVIKSKGFSLDEFKRNIIQVNASSYFGETLEDAMIILNNEQIDLLFIYLAGINDKDINIIEYTNTYHPDTKVVIMGDRKVLKIISVLSNGNFALIEEPVDVIKQQYSKN